MAWPARNIRQVSDIGAAQARVQKYFLNSSAAELRQQFDIQDRDIGDRPGTYHVTMVPKRKQIRETLARLDLWVDRSSLLLSAMQMTFANGDSKTMVLDDVVPNAVLEPGTFSAAPVGEPIRWLVRNRPHRRFCPRGRPIGTSSGFSAISRALRMNVNLPGSACWVHSTLDYRIASLSPVDSLVSTIVSWTHRRRGLVVVAVLCATLVSLAGVHRLSFDTDVLSLLPHDGRVLQSFRTFLSRFGSLDQLYVVFTAAEGHTVSEYADEIDAWVERPRQAPEIGRVDTGVVDRTRDFGWLADRQLLLLPNAPLNEALRRLRSRWDAGRRRRPARAAVGAVFRGRRAGSSGSAGPVRAAARRARRHAGRAEPGHQRGRLRHARTATAGSSSPVRAVRRTTRRSRARSTRVYVRSTRRSAAAPDAARQQDEDALPPLQVEFAGGHRIAVETEASSPREHLEHGRLAGADPAAAVHRIPKPLAGRRRIAALGDLAASSCSAGSASPARGSRRPPPARRRCCSASASTASCCSTSPIAMPSPRTRRTRCGDRRTVEQHAARHVDHRGHVLRPDRSSTSPACSSSAG